MPQVAAVVVAAGQGLRAGGDMPKQFREIGGASLLRRSLLGFASVPAVSALQPVVRKDDIDLVREHTRDIRILPPVFGGATRQASVRAGLEALSSRSPDIVLVHDAARPFASADLIARAIAAAEKTGAAIPVLPVTDTVKRAWARRHYRKNDRSRTSPPGADAASLRLRCAARRSSPRRRERAATILPTTPRWPNGPA